MGETKKLEIYSVSRRMNKKLDFQLQNMKKHGKNEKLI